MKPLSKPAFALLVLSAVAMSMTMPGCPNPSEMTDLKTEVKSLSADVTLLKETVKQMTLVMQQQGTAIQALQSRPAATKPASASAKKTKKKKGR
jgi:outer membrane murein-binding lipoprotein Lpp